MSLDDINTIRSNADMIVCGYAFSRMADTNIQVLQLSCPNHALELSSEGEVIEASMDDVELDIVMGYLFKNRKFMEEAYA